VLTYTWIYAARLRLPAPSLDEIAAGEFPRFTPLAAQGKLSGAAPRVH
jgi:soluble lytic murein transglycosylase